ncbi:MAG: hypothetical protein FJX83_06135 [Bacteroidetes bacterium]|nr:hypothetical protein [Bacteroidota bacterium]
MLRSPWLLILWTALVSWAQPGYSQVPADPAQVQFVQVIRANKFIRVKQDLSTELNMLVGNVLMKQGNTLIQCDSAIQNIALNQIEAFDNIHINDNDSIHTYSNYMKYDGNTKIAQLKGKVRLTDGKGTLTTDALDYNVGTKIGTYSTGGKVVNEKSVLTSRVGIYYADIREVYFQKNVSLVDPEYKMSTDTLLYNVNTETATFIARTTINDGKSKILTRSGFYNLKKGNAQFDKRPMIIDSTQTVLADSIVYNKKSGEGSAYRDVIYKDTIQGISMFAGAARFNNQTKAIVAFERPLMAIKQNSDSLFISADTLFSAFLKKDSAKKILSDTLRYYKAFFNVRIYSDSLQGKCDSLFYSSVDSTFSFYHNPVIWAQASQITGDTIFVVTRNKKADKVFVIQNAFSVNRTSEAKYNQLKGNTLNGEFKDGEIDFLRAKGNGESLYYLQDDDSAYIGMSYAMADAITMKFLNKELKRVSWVNGVTGSTYPINQIPDDKKELRNFKWLDAERPKSIADLKLR